jgi:hypothetical protein
MFSFFKNFLHIDSVKLRLNLLEAYPSNVPTLNGEVEIRGGGQRVESVNIRFIEVYTRGRGDDKRIEEHTLGTWQHTEPFTVAAEQPTTLFFRLPFERLKSNIDAMGERNFLLRPIASLARTLKGVSSEFYLIAEAQVQGASLRPNVKAKIQFTNPI